MTARRALACWVLLVACGKGAGAPQPTAAVHGQPPPMAAAPPTAAAANVAPALPPTAAAVPRPPFRVLHSSTPESNALGPPLPGIGSWLTTGSGEASELEIDVNDGARVRLGPATQLWSFERDPGALLLVRGRLAVQLLPEAPRADRTTLRLVTAHGTLLVPSAGEFSVAVHAGAPNRASVPVCMVRGAIELLRYAASGVQRQLVLAERASYPQTGSVQVSSAKTSADAQRAIDKASRGSRDQPALIDADQHLDAALQGFAKLRAEGDRLLAAVSPAHAQALHASAGAIPAAPRNEAEIRSYQRELATHAQRKQEQRQLLLLAAEQSLLARLMRCPAPSATGPVCPALRTWQERYSTALADNLAPH